jgi:hypothetical protein
MDYDNYKVGDKVVPHAKTYYNGTIGLETSHAWCSARANGQPFLFVKEIHQDHLMCGSKLNKSGDYFAFDDVTPYDMNPKMGDWVYVADDKKDIGTSDGKRKRIFLYAMPNGRFICVSLNDEDKYQRGDDYEVTKWNYVRLVPPVPPKPTSYEVKLNNRLTAIITKDDIKVDCQHIDPKVLPEITEALNKLNKCEEQSH